MVTGQVPFERQEPLGRDAQASEVAARAAGPRQPRHQRGLREVIEMMMAKSRRERYKTISDVLTDLRALERGEAPPIARKEPDLSMLEETSLGEEEALPDVVQVRRVYTGNPFQHPVVLAMLFILIASVILNVIVIITI
jgi:hypothetical protein